MNIQRITEGDIVACVRRGRRFVALVTGRQDARLTLTPITYNCSYCSATGREVDGHWARRPQRDGKPVIRAIRNGDLIAFTDNGQLSYGEVLARDRRTLTIRELGPPTQQRSLTTSDVATHFARGARRRTAR